MKMNSSIKKVLCACIALILLFVCGACSKKDEKTYSLYDLNKAMCAVADYSDMKYASSSDENPEGLFKHISEMDYSKVDSFFITYASNGTGNADEIACIQVKSSKDVGEAEESLNAHLKNRIGLYSNYDKSQLEKLSNAVIAKYGNVVVLIVGDNVTKTEKAFFEFFDNAQG